MNENRGLVTAELSAPPGTGEKIASEILAAINDRIKPLSPLTVDDIHVRAMYIVSDRVNSYGGRFPADEFPQLAELLVDSPVLIGHRKDSLPIGRTFRAEIVERDGRPWIKSSFYWLRSSAEAERLRADIDGGVCKECSIGFTFLKPECSICGEDIRQCRHLPLETYIIGEQEQHCHFAYREIQQVLETSLVYRGATPDTSIVKDLSILKSPEPDVHPTRLQSLDQLEESETYLLVPRYEGIDISFRMHNGVAVGWRSDGRRVNLSMFGKFRIAGSAESQIYNARLVGLRGKERCSTANIERFLRSESGPVSRLMLYVYPEQDGLAEIANSSSRHRVQIFRHRHVNRTELSSAAAMLATKHGVEIIRAGNQPGEIAAYLYFPEKRQSVGIEQVSGLLLVAHYDNALLSIADGQESRRYILRNFSAPLFCRGRRFVADEIPQGRDYRRNGGTELLKDPEATVQLNGETLMIASADPKVGTIAITPVLLHGRRRSLVYRTLSSPSVLQEACHAD